MRGDGDWRGGGRGASLVVTFFTALLTTVAAFAGLTLADQRGLLPFLHGGVREVEVPSIAGVSVEQGRELLQARGLMLTLQGERPDPNVPAGKIATQVPLAGSRAVSGTQVVAFVSSGSAAVAIPAVAGARPEDAVELLRSRKLLAGPRREEPSTTVAAGLVIDSDPPAGRSVALDTAVALVVSTGPAPKAVPRIVGLRPSRAQKVLEDAGFKLGSKKYGSSDDADEGVVIRQDPADKALAPPGTAVNLTINE
jgi:beta-lactam-binding protein with PASTA domain